MTKPQSVEGEGKMASSQKPEDFAARQTAIDQPHALPSAPPRTYSQVEVDAILKAAFPAISQDGPHKIDAHRQWLARQLLDSKMTAREAFEAVAYSPAVTDVLPPRDPFQGRVRPWMHACFGDVIPYDRTERGDRLLEEVFELLQSGGYEQSRVAELCDYTWNRPPGEPAQEVGGVMVTLAAYCLAFGLDMHAAGETELARIWTKVEAIRAKQAAKPRGIALPVDPAAPAKAEPQP